MANLESPNAALGLTNCFGNRNQVATRVTTTISRPQQEQVPQFNSIPEKLRWVNDNMKLQIEWPNLNQASEFANLCVENKAAFRYGGEMDKFPRKVRIPITGESRAKDPNTVVIENWSMTKSKRCPKTTSSSPVPTIKDSKLRYSRSTRKWHLQLPRLATHSSQPLI